MLHTLKQLVSEQLQKQAVVIRRTFIERAEPSSQAAHDQRPRYFSDSVVVTGWAACCNAEGTPDIYSSSEEVLSEAPSPDSESSDGEGLPAPRTTGCGGDGSFLDAESWEGAVAPGSHWGAGQLSSGHVRTLSPCSSARHSGAAPLVPAATSAFPSLPIIAPAPSTQAVQDLAAAAGHGPQFFALLVPAMAGQSGTIAVAPMVAGGAVTSPSTSSPPGAAAPTASAAVAEETGVAGPCTQETRTTVMVRNLPNDLTRELFLALLDKLGLAGLYDFVYLPVDFQTGSGLGYGFVNLVDPSDAPRLWAALDGFRRWAVRSRKRCSLAWNEPHQGLYANILRFRNSAIMHPSVPDSYKPVVFSDGVRAPFPAPTKAIKAPRLRK